MSMKKAWHIKFLRIGIWSTGVLVILLIATHIFLNTYVPSIIRNKINHLVIDGSDSLYKCSIGKISINIWAGNASIENINITIDSVKYKQQKKSGKLPNITYELRLSEGSITGLRIFPLIFTKKIIIETIRVEKANILLCRQHKEKKKPAPTEESLWKTMNPYIKGIYINSISLVKTKFSYRHSENEKDVSFAYKDCSVNLQHIRIDSIGASNSSRILFTEDISIRFAGLNYFTPDSMYNLKMDSLSYSSFSKKIKMKNFSLKPTMTPAAFTKKHGMQIDIFETYITELTALNFKIEKIFTDNELCVDSIILKKPIIKINRDRTAHFDTTSQYGKYPNEALAKAPFVIKIPMVILDEAEIHYVEIQKLSHKTGDAFFTKVTGTITNITNYKEDIEKNNHCKFNLNGYFLKHGKLHVQLDFDLASTTGNYNAVADMGPISVDELNTVFVPFANVHLKTMNMHAGHIKFSGNSKGITGTARLLYDDLKIEILKPNPKTHQVKKQGFVSFFANLFVIRAHNRVGKKEVIANHIYVHRKRRQPFANLIWEFFFESLKKVILKVPIPNLKVEM